MPGVRAAWFGVMAVSLIAPMAYGADEWKPGAAPKYTGEIASQTEAELPTDRSRTSLGVGEKVTCSIDPTKFTDVDCRCVTDHNRCEPGDDAIGAIAWSSSGKFEPVEGNTASVTVTARKRGGAGKVTVTISDAGNKANDPAEKDVVKSKDFTIVEPSGLTIYTVTKAISGPNGDAIIGTGGHFFYRILPTSVNFYNCGDIYEYKEQTDWNWPDGTQDNNGNYGWMGNGPTVTYTFPPSTEKIWNLNPDTVGIAGRKRVRLDGKDFTINTGEPDDPLRTRVYWSSDGMQTEDRQLTETTMYWCFQGATGKGCTVVQLSSGESMATEWQGPFGE